jgi:ATP-dependent DNA helicase RecG
LAPDGLISLQDPVGKIPRLGPARAARLSAAGLATVGGFLLALPFRYEDRRRYASVATLAAGEAATLLVRLTGVRTTRMRRGGLRIEAAADDETGAVRVVWHNRYPSFAERARKGGALVLYGTPMVTSRGELRLENPETEFFDPGEEADPLHSGRIVGVYHRAAGIGSRASRVLARSALDVLSATSRAATLSGSGLRDALENAHFPRSQADADTARDLLAREELLVLAAGIEARRARLRERRGIVLSADAAIREAARRALPFPLTQAQKRVLREIAADVSSGRAMARLLQGDVGSGKTIVAGLALLLAAKNGVQGALMAPTEILAEQHAAALASWLEKAGVRLGLLTGRARGRESSTSSSEPTL